MESTIEAPLRCRRVGPNTIDKFEEDIRFVADPSFTYRDK
jgi:hypothetical protein